jgi:uncharacterized membrane protein
MTKASGKALWIPVLIAILLIAHNSWGLRIPREIHPDEIWTMDMIVKTPSRLLYSILTEDNHPPLYYFLLNVWSTIAGPVVPKLRVLSFLFSCITIFFFVAVYRHYRRAEVIFVLGLMATNPLFTYYSATVRPYSLLVLLASIMTITALKLRQLNSTVNPGKISMHSQEVSRSQRPWSITYYLSALLLGITHYFGTLYVWLIVIFNLLTPSRKIDNKPWRSILLMLITAIWPILQIGFGTLDQQKESNSWVNVFPLISTTNNFLSGTFPLLMISRSIPQLLFGVVLALILLLLIIRQQTNHPHLLAALRQGKPTSLLSLDPIFLSLICFSILAFGCVADLILPFTTPYYFLVCLPAVAILFGKAVVSCYQDKFKVWLCVSAYVAITGLQILLTQQRLAAP